MITTVNDAPVNYAKAAGIDSFILALVFCVIYIPLFVVFFVKWMRNTVYVLGAAALFCIVRIAAFGMRAAFTKSSSLADNKNMVIAESIIYSIGFFGLLSGAYNLVLDREEAVGTQNPDPLRFVTGNRHIMRMIMSAAVVMGVIGAIDSQDPTKSAAQMKTGTNLRKISIVIFLVVCILMVVHTLLSITAEKKSSPDEKAYTSSFGHTHGMKVLLITGLFLTLREVFYITTMNNLKRQEEEKLFYPFGALPELLAVLTLLVPHLVPPTQGLLPR
jgi:hypothetical protein